MARRTLSSVSGFSTEIGFYLSGMEEVREQLREAVAGMPDEQISQPAIPGAHSIAALVCCSNDASGVSAPLHIGEAEWWWIQSVISGHQVTDEIRNAP